MSISDYATYNLGVGGGDLRISSSPKGPPFFTHIPPNIYEVISQILDNGCSIERIEAYTNITIMGGRIDAYLDCASPYSYFAILHLRKNRPLLEQYGVEIEFHPIFLGGVNVATGNKPPSTLPAKAKYGPYDLKRAIKYFNTEPLSSPSFFPLLSLLPQRSLIYIKHTYPQHQFETTFLSLWIYTFVKHINLADTANLQILLSDTSVGNTYSPTEIQQIMNGANSPTVKSELTAQTKKVVEEYGAYGAPWFWVTNYDTKMEEPVFGSDRWVYIYEFLGVKWRDVEIVDLREEQKAKL